MRKLLSAFAFVVVFCAAEAAAQVYVPPPINVPAPTDYSSIAVRRAIGRAAMRRAALQSRRGRVKATAAAATTPSRPKARRARKRASVSGVSSALPPARPTVAGAVCLVAEVV